MKTQKYILVGFLVAALALVGTFVFQQDSSSESETTPVSQNELSQSQTTISSNQESETEEPVTVKGKISVSFE